MAKTHRPLPTREINVYDTMFDGIQDARIFYEGGHTRLFGNQNVGQNELSNLFVPGQLACGATAWICNWYARTNIPPCAELDAWAHSTPVQLVVGSQPQVQLSLFDLLRRPQGYTLPLGAQPLGADPKDQSLQMIESATRRAHQAFQEIVGTRSGLFDLSPLLQAAWRNVAQTMLKTFNFLPVIVVPVRQNFSVAVDGNAGAFAALREHVKAYGEGEDAISPRARLWIHVEGFSYEEERLHKGFNADLGDE